MRQRLAQEVPPDHEVGVEDGHEVAARALEAVGEGAGLEPAPVGPVKMDDVDSLLLVLADEPPRKGQGLVGRIVQDLYLQQVAGIVELAGGPDEPLRDVELVIDRQLDRYAGCGGVHERLDVLVPLLLAE